MPTAAELAMLRRAERAAAAAEAWLRATGGPTAPTFAAEAPSERGAIPTSGSTRSTSGAGRTSGGTSNRPIVTPSSQAAWPPPPREPSAGISGAHDPGPVPRGPPAALTSSLMALSPRSSLCLAPTAPMVPGGGVEVIQPYVAPLEHHTYAPLEDRVVWGQRDSGDGRSTSGGSVFRFSVSVRRS